MTCFPSAIATYLLRYDVDYMLALGLQLYLATHIVEEQSGPKGTFVYFHRPLWERSPLFALHLKRHWEDDRTRVRELILQEWRRRGHLIIIGDTFNLPWQMNYRRKHAAHWFSLEEINEAEQTAHIRDSFEFVDVHGTQLPYDSWVPLADLIDLAKAYSTPSEAYLARDLYGLGSEEQVPLQAYQGYQWFEAIDQVETYKLSRMHLIEELLHTYQHMSGSMRRADLQDKGWRTGLEAVANLKRLFQQYLENNQLYTMRDDLWGVARHHLLFFHALRRMAAEIGEPYLDELADWGIEVLVPRWFAIPRLMLYNGSRLLKQGSPKAVLIQLAEEVYQAELECMRKLAVYLVDVEGIELPDVELPGSVATSTISERTSFCAPGAGTRKAANTVPENPIEKIVTEAWESVLETRVSGIYDDFFQVGGDSLKATRIVSRLSLTFQIEISLLTFLERPSIAELAQAIEGVLLEKMENVPEE